MTTDTSVVKHSVWRCKCRDCKDRRNAHDRARRAARGGPSMYTDAEPVRHHVRALMAQGMGRKRIAKAAGVADQTVGNLLYGNSRSNKKPRRIHVMNAKRLMAVEFDCDHLGDGSVIDGTGVRRRLQALVVQGWTHKAIADRLDRAPSQVNALLKGYRSRVTMGTFREVVELHREWWDQEPPQVTDTQRRGVRRAKTLAAKYGYMPTAAWDDIDDAAEEPRVDAEPDPDYVDTVRVWNVIAGRTGPAELSRAERREAAKMLLNAGYKPTTVGGRLNMSHHSVRRVLDEVAA